jgi:putative tryptophan/tyrosine transport system substrate-binding protein
MSPRLQDQLVGDTMPTETTRLTQLRHRLRIAVQPPTPVFSPINVGFSSLVCHILNFLGVGMQRRTFITLFAGAAVARPFATRAQQAERMRRIGVLVGVAADDPEGQARLTIFVQALQQLGWIDGHNMRIDVRWGAVDADRYRKYAEELVALAPDVILAGSSAALAPLQQATRSVPIVFAGVADPVGGGYVDSLARPGGNVTGFALFEYGIAGKWLELLTQIAPAVTRAAVMRDPAISLGIGQWAVVQAMAPSTGVDLSLVNMRDAGEIERDVAAFARSSNGGLIVTAGPWGTVHRELIISLAARHKLPAVYFERFFVTGGGLISYGPHMIDQYQRAAGYVDRMLKGEKAADLPVQVPTTYELAINLKTAKALGLTVPPSVLARANEVIE